MIPYPVSLFGSVKSRRWRLSAAVIGATLAGFAASAAAQNAPDQLTVHRSDATGRAFFVTAADGGVIPVAKRVGRGAVGPLDFLYEYGHVFGATNPQQQLRQARQTTDDLANVHTSYQQYHSGIKVFGGVLRVHQDGAGRFVAANGDFFAIPDKLPTVPSISQSKALTIAREAFGASDAQALRTELNIVDPGWYGDRTIGPRLAYHIELADPSVPAHESFFVDAHSGRVLDRWSQVCPIRQRFMYSAVDGDSIPGVLIRSEGEPPLDAWEDVNRAYDYFGDVYDYYFRAFGRDSIDDAGMPLVATVDWYSSGNCPNAFWFPAEQQMVFCADMITDDIVAHELTHGVTEHTANLIYQNQPGQLNEAFSDIFGELVDLFNGNAAWPGEPGAAAWPTHPTGAGLDFPNNLRSGASLPPSHRDGYRWIMGEDSRVGAIRDMWDPESYGDPAHAFSAFQTCAFGDYGGVHSGSGVLNHAFAIATDGKTFNGETVRGIGPIKSGAVWYRALTVYLVPTADFQDTYAALNQAASDLLGSYPPDPRTGTPSDSEFTADDAAQIDAALRAVELNTLGRCGVLSIMDAEVPETCPTARTIFADDFEAPDTAWETASMGYGGHAWRRVANLPDGRPGSAWFIANPDVDCYGYDDSTTRARLTSPEIVLPADVLSPQLRFSHAVQTEDYFDGGNLKYQVNDGAWQLVPPQAFLHNSYNRIALFPPAYGTNPLASQPAFSGWGGEWYTSIVDLTAFAAGGDRVRLRFEFGMDSCGGLQGWYIDDVQIVDCPESTDCNLNGIADEVEVAIERQPRTIAEYDPLFVNYLPLTPDYAASVAVAFTHTQGREIHSLNIWGGFENGVPDHDAFTVRILDYNNVGEDFPGEAIFTEEQVSVAYELLPIDLNDTALYKLTLRLSNPLSLPPGRYVVEIYTDLNTSNPFYWSMSQYAGMAVNENLLFVASERPGEEWYSLGDWYYGDIVFVSLAVNGADIGGDCNANLVPDDCDVAAGTSVDCNSNGLPDNCDLADGVSTDCDANFVPDECQPDGQVDSDSDGAIDLCDACPLDPDKFDPGICGCGVADTDSDRDGAADCNDGCPQDAAKTAPGSCGCGVAETDSDGDGSADCVDGCRSDPAKTAPGDCGCGKPDTDSDGDGVADCIDVCTNGDDSIDTDDDGTPDCADECPNDPEDTIAGQCGCGQPEYDPDRDTVASCIDNCPMNANPDQRDADGDGLGDMCDGCPDDPNKTAAGLCGCGAPDVDSDDDGVLDCADNCPNDPTTNRADRDDDGVGDACDGCPDDPNKTAPGICGCGRADRDDDNDGVTDCRDGCLNTPAGANVDSNGCIVPDIPPPPQPTPEPDADGDGVPDSEDDCPDTETGVEVGTNGCALNAGIDDPNDNPDDQSGCGAGAPCGAMGAISLMAILFGLSALRTRRRR